MTAKMIHDQATSSEYSQDRTTNVIQRDVLENDKPSFQVKEKLFTPSEFTLAIGDCEVIASSHDIDILANLLDGKRDNLDTTFEFWIAKLLENETGRKKTVDLNEKIKESLNRQLQDGLLNYHEYIDLEYVGRVWVRLLSALDIYNLGSTCTRKDVLSLLLELFELKQITKELFIEYVLKFIV